MWNFESELCVLKLMVILSEFLAAEKEFIATTSGSSESLMESMGQTEKQICKRTGVMRVPEVWEAGMLQCLAGRCCWNK